MDGLTKRDFSQICDFVVNRPGITVDEVLGALHQALDLDWRVMATSYCFYPYIKEELKRCGKEGAITLIGGAGFPYGNWPTEIKRACIRHCLDAGAGEFDLTCNISWIKSGMYQEIRDEVLAVREIIGPDRAMRLFTHAPILTEDEIKALADIVAETGVNYFKTGSGREGAATTAQLVATVKRHLGHRAGIKASGGIRTKEDVLAMYEAGATRFGVSYKNALQIYHELND